ncbi:hypothetical protein F5Y09DRAFT_348390 [Xylaria sp. FL1042]|nr:hypothetical protein F5Y09DRAFT_348390 [Xylaria sp. FL1042]
MGGHEARAFMKWVVGASPDAVIKKDKHSGQAYSSRPAKHNKDKPSSVEYLAPERKAKRRPARGPDYEAYTVFSEDAGSHAGSRNNAVSHAGSKHDAVSHAGSKNSAGSHAGSRNGSGSHASKNK